jgi:hypothetical protein
MSLVLLDARASEEGITATFATENSVEQLTGSCAEVARLAAVMKQVAVLAELNDGEDVWLDEVVVGDAVVRLGLKGGGEARVAIIRPTRTDPSPVAGC